MNLDAERDRLLALAEKATPGPWGHNAHGSVMRIDLDEWGDCIAINGPNTPSLKEKADMDFIAAAHDMAALIRAQAAELDSARRYAAEVRVSEREEADKLRTTIDAQADRIAWLEADGQMLREGTVVLEAEIERLKGESK